MAKTSMTTLTLAINDQQAKRVLESLKTQIDSVKKTLEETQEKFRGERAWDVGDTAEKIDKQIKVLKKELRSLNSAYDQGITQMNGIDEKLKSISKASYNQLTKDRTTLTNTLKGLKKDSQENLKAYEETAERLQKIRDEIAKRDIDVKGSATELKAKEVMKDLEKYSTSEIQDAIKTTEKLAGQQTIGSKAWKEYSDQIKNANAVLDKFKDKAQLQAMSDQFKQLGNLSASALSEQKKYWQEMANGAAAGSKELAVYQKNLANVIAEEQKRSKDKSGKVMSNLSGYSVNEIKDAIKATEQLRDAQKPGSKAWADYSAQIKAASEYLESFKNKAKLDVMNSQFKDLGKLSADALAEQKKYWESMANGAAAGSKELDLYRKKLAEITDEEQKRNAASVKNVMSSPAKYSVAEIREAIKVTEQLRDAQRPGSAEWKNYSDQIANANAVLDKFKDKAKLESMTAQFKQLGNLSTSALAEQKKYWKAMVDGAEKGSRELQTYERKLKNVINEEKRRTTTSGRELRDEVLSGNWKGTIGDAKEAVKTLKEYKETLNTTDTAAIRRVDAAISELNNKTKLAEAGFKSTNEALKSLWRQTKNLGYGNWKGSIAELEEMRRKLITIRDTQEKVLTPKDRDRLQKSLANIDKELAILKGDAIDINHVLMNMKDTPLWKLEKAAEQLKKEIRDCSENTRDFAEKAAQLRRVNKQIESLKKKFKETENVVTRTAKRLMAYVAVYGGFNFAIGKIKEMAQANLQLSDTFADIQKTTGLAAEEIKELSSSIDSIDTRTSQQQLHELAAVAGQLGLKSQTDILGFVRASNMISVSLNELGSEGTASLMKIATLTGEASQGTEKALLSIGSAINELTANSAATAGPIVDLMKRMGGVASQAGLTSAQMAAIGATADALGQSMEITGTSMNKFITTLMSNSDDIAYALNMDAKALRDLLNEGKTMEAMIAVFDKMKGMGGMEKLAGVMGELGSEGARMTQVLTALASNVDFLRGQVELSSEAYEDAISIQDEYNIKNENALALWQRLGNTLREQVVNSKFVSILESISRAIFNVVNAILEGGRAARIFTSAVFALTAALIAQRIEWVKNMNALKFAKGWQALKATIDAITVSIKANIVAMTTSTGRIGLWNKMVVSATMTWKKFLVVLRANWLTALIAGVAALVGWFSKLITYTSELTRATVRYHREVEEEKSQVDALFLSLRRTNKESNNRAKIIDQINRKYGDYLGFMLSEKDSADKLAAAHKLINSELEKRMALNLQSTLQGKAASEYAAKYEEETTDIARSIKGEGLFNSDRFKNLVNPAEVNAFVNKLVNDAVTNAIDTSGEFRKIGEIDMTEVMNNIKSKLQEKFNTVKDLQLFRDAFSQKEGLGGILFGQIKGNIENLIEARVGLMEDTFAAERAAEVEMGRITQSAIKDREAMLKQIETDYNKLNELDVPTKTEQEQKDHYAKMLDNAQDYVDNATKILREIPEAEREATDDQLNANINKYKEAVKKLAPLADVDPWGKARDVKDWKEFADIVTNLDSSSANALAAAYKALTEDTAKIPSDVKSFYKMFEGTGLETKLKLDKPEDVAKQVHNWAEQIKNKLKTKYGRNTSGGFIFDSESSGKAKKTANEMYKEWLAELEAYYNERVTLIRQNGMKEKKLETEINRELEALNIEKLSIQRELEEGLLNDLYKNSTFDPTKFKGVITGTEYFANMSLKQMRAIISAGGPKIDAEIRKNLTDRMVKIEEQAYKIKQRIEKILLEDDFSGKVTKEYMASLNELGLLFNIKTEEQSKQTEAEGERRLAYMREWAQESYSINATALEDKIKSNALFSEWVKDRDKEDYEALLVQLRKFYDDQEEADRKAAERRKRIFDKSAKGLKLQKEGEESVQKAETKKKDEEGNTKMWDRFRGMGLVGDDKIEEKQIEVGKAQIAVYQAKIDASKAYILQMQAEMYEEKKKVKESIDNIKNELANTSLSADQRSKLNAKLLAAEQHYQSLMRQESLMTKAEEDKISEARANQVEEYQVIAERYIAIEQNKIERMKEYTDAIVEFSGQMGEAAWSEVEDRKEAGKQLIKSLLTTLKEHIQIKLTELAMEKLFSQQSTALKGQEIVTNLNASGTEAGATVAIEGVKATAKETGKLGWKGLIVGAAISAALSALLGVAMGALNKSKAKIASETGAGGGKLATGMLTYAEGNYPVLGNDGNVYNAKYEGAGMKTGIYRGGAHFGIFSEKKPEAIIDGDTTQRLIMNHPDIWKAIVTLSKTGRLEHGMRTFNSGNIDQLAKQMEGMETNPAATGNAEMILMQSALERNSQVMAQLMQVLAGGIKANINMYGDDGMYKNMKKAERFASVRKYK